MKHKQGERETAAQAEKAAEKFMMKEERSEVEFTDYEFTPMHTLFLYGFLQKNHRKIYILISKVNRKVQVEAYGDQG
ncbi:hypothetical protein JOD45_000640 [Scopulibacillus daqui]|uniref:Uncharacterized protein n=1 Tax=Scopulibacillus daqui TaxID=1469162 RepID=A0ABS2PWM6_9BACL|nr:hypothetical protein [Scopulibacillus daqui]MBM7644447.1 hypothetical protein [Scopulibacillus daqui]